MSANTRPFQLYETEAGYIFDTWALREAIRQIDISQQREFQPSHLDALLDNFCDWSDARVGSYSTLISKPKASVQSLPNEEKENLFFQICEELSNQLTSHYGTEVEADDLHGLVITLSELTQDVHNFHFDYLWQFARMVRDFDPDKNSEIGDVQSLLDATRELPSVYHDTKRSQYENEIKVNKIRFRLLEEFKSEGQIDVSALGDIKQSVVEQADDDILRNWRDYTIVGQLFYDYFKPRIDFYLETIADRLEKEYSEYNIERHIVNFQGPRNQLSDHAWIALHGGPPGTQKERYQLYLGIHGDRASVGLHVGGEIRSGDWEDKRDLDEIERKEAFTLDRVLDKFHEVEDDFLSLEFNGGNGPSPNDVNYFWATADPSIWSVEEIEGGGEVFYSLYNEKDNRKRIADAFEAASPGDRVVFYESTPSKEVVAEGTVTEGLDEQAEHQDQGVRIRFDRSIAGIGWDELISIPALEDAQPIVNRAQGTLFSLTQEEFENILALEDTPGGGVSEEVLNQLQNKLTPPNFDISIPPTLYFEDADKLTREINASLNSGKHIIFTGPPGTGKTKLAKSLCAEVTQFEQVDDFRFTTATSEWTAFDTVGGYVPSTQDGGQELEFEPRMFLKCFRQDQVVNEWLIIDEINRSDIDKAFGQMFSVLSADSTELPYERERTVELRSLTTSATQEELEDTIANPDAFPVTPSWRLIATMNTYDKSSLYEMSYAFMRRFNFIHVGVPELLNETGVRTSLLDPNAGDNFATVWIAEDESIQPILEKYHVQIAVLWQRINQYRPIGPAIVYDIIRFLRSFSISGESVSQALSSAVVTLVFPQLEGLRPDEQKQLIRSLSDTDIKTESGPADLQLDESFLMAKAEDFFGISFEDGS